jgi:tetratricopeptide (TPR) repeat protein
MRAAERLFKKGDTSMAAAYFWSAGNTFREIKEYELSANAYEKAAYCYESENRWEKAVEEYLSASKMYERSGSSVKAEAMKRNAEKMKMLQKKET